MAKLKRLSGKEVVKIMKNNGYSQIRQRGSHCVMQKPGNPTVTVPVPLHKELKTGTLQSIIRQSGLVRNLFE